MSEQLFSLILLPWEHGQAQKHPPLPWEPEAGGMATWSSKGTLMEMGWKANWYHPPTWTFHKTLYLQAHLKVEKRIQHLCKLGGKSVQCLEPWMAELISGGKIHSKDCLSKLGKGFTFSFLESMRQGLPPKLYEIPVGKCGCFWDGKGVLRITNN